MQAFQFNLLKLCSILGISALFTAPVFATGATALISVNNAAASPIPTLSGTMLIVLSLLLFTFAFRVSRQKNKGASKFFIAVLGITALTAGGGGIKLMTEVQAGGAPSILMQPDIQIYRLLNDPGNPSSGFNGFLTNNSGQPIIVQSITPDNTSTCSFTGNGGNPCSGASIPLNSALTFPDGQSCLIICMAINNGGGDASDLRLKQDITFLTELKNGIKLYSFKYIPDYTSDRTTYVGVMAQDLLQDSEFKGAVSVMENNYYAVNYSALKLKMITFEEWTQSADNIRKL